MKPIQFLKIGTRVAFAQDTLDTGTIVKAITSRFCPTWDKKESTPLEYPVRWYLVKWDNPARPGEPDPETWFTASDLTLEVRQ